MPTLLIQRLVQSHDSPAVIVIRFLAGGVFFIEGVKKFLLAAQWGAGRFAKIGIPLPDITGPFVGGVEIVCGLMLLMGLLTRLGAILLLIDISVAIATTKVPILLKSGFFAMEDPARTDYSMFMSLLFLLIVGGGRWSLDMVRLSRRLIRSTGGGNV
ncbi:MAG: DoxX family protein [Acidobacteriia bacterium]|nr:DoxX family protein [Terriglobia bacterium]